MRFRLGALGSIIAVAGALSSSCTDTGVEPLRRGPVVADVQPASSGTLVITGNTTLTGNHFGNIQIAADNIKLDCAGDTVFGPGVSGFSGGIEVDGRTGVTVTNCTVTGFNVNGVFGGGTSNSTFTANLLYGNGNHGIHLDFGNANVLVGNTSRSNGAIGIVQTRATQTRLEANTVQDNKNWAGIALFDGSHDNVVVSNTAIGNAIGFLLDNGANANQLRENTARLNTNNGFLIRASTNNIVVANTAQQNAVGLTLWNVSANQFHGNNALFNQLGFEVIQGSSGNTLDSNTANRDLIGFAIYDGSSSNTITRNVANANRDNGFLFQTTNGNTVTANTGNSNGDWGFLVIAGSSFNTLTGNIGHANGFDALDDGSGTGNAWANNNFGTTAGIP